MSVNFVTAAYAGSESLQFNLKLSVSRLELKGSAAVSGSLAASDSGEISAAAREMAARCRELDVFKVIFPDSDPRRQVKTLAEVQADFQADFNHFAEAFGLVSGQLGLEAGQTLTMGLNGVGGLTVTGEDSSGSADKAENLFNRNQTLVSRFAVMAARAALVDAADTIEGFPGAYASDPFAAIKDNLDQLKQRLLGFRVQAGESQTAYGFLRDFELEIAGSSTEVCWTGFGEEGSPEETSREAVPEGVVIPPEV
ncbi:MAG: hypothetical protein LBU64_03690 [Planctomycetota bacterium]|jgi:hypothetical protein|nr:hypothetical protein [Planctomycetota bacterium]